MISWRTLWQCKANSCPPSVMQAEVDGLRGDVAQLFLALKAAETRHQQELAGVIVNAAQHQTKVTFAATVPFGSQRFSRLPGTMFGDYAQPTGCFHSLKSKVTLTLALHTCVRFSA